MTDAQGGLSLFVLNRDIKVANTQAAPDNVTPTALAEVEVQDRRLRLTVAPAPWNVLRFIPA